MRTAVLLGAGLSSAITFGAAGANCALRNPSVQIYQIFPDATSYRTVVAKVDAELLPLIQKKVGSELTRADVGKHTAYVVLKDTVPIGFVHARTENGTRGSVELVWGMGLDMTIKDFRVQRSREKHTEAIKSDEFRAKLTGRDLQSLRTLLTQGNHAINPLALEIPAGAATIAHCVVLCGLKTRVITELAFRDSIKPARMLGHLYEHVPDTKSVTSIKTPLGDETAAAVKRLIGAAPSQLDRGSLVVLRAAGEDGATKGLLVQGSWTSHPRRPECWWVVSPEGRLRAVWIVGEVDQSVKQQFAVLRGKELATLQGQVDLTIDSPARCGLEVLAVLAAHGFGGMPSGPAGG